jgi:hypothetical protein
MIKSLITKYLCVIVLSLISLPAFSSGEEILTFTVTNLQMIGEREELNKRDFNPQKVTLEVSLEKRNFLGNYEFVGPHYIVSYQKNLILNGEIIPKMQIEVRKIELLYLLEQAQRFDPKGVFRFRARLSFSYHPLLNYIYVIDLNDKTPGTYIEVEREADRLPIKQFFHFSIERSLRGYYHE